VDIQSIRKKINEAKKTNTHLVFKKLFTDTPSWDEIFNHMTYEYYKEPKLNFPEEYIVNGGVAFNRGMAYAQIRDASFHDKYKKVSSFFNEVFNDISPGGGVYLDLIFGREKVNFHPDPSDNLHWQIIGITTWEFKKNELQENPDSTIKLYPGDIVFIPDGLWHSVYSNTPRCGMTIPYSVRHNITDNG